MPVRLVTLASAALALAGAAAAQPHCQAQRNANGFVGALAGATLGGVAGAAIADDDVVFVRRGFRRGRFVRRDNDAGAIALGAILGGLAGGALGAAATDCRPQVVFAPPPPVPPSPPPPARRGKGAPLLGGPSVKGAAPADCRLDFVVVGYHQGRPIQEPVDVCRDASGAWVPTY